MKNINKNTIQSVDRAVQILKCFESNLELGITDISELLGLHKSTVFGLVSTLYQNGLLDKNEISNKYILGLELYRIGTRVNVSLRNLVVPYLEKAVNKFHETTNLVIAQDLDVFYLEKVNSRQAMIISTLIGGRKPIYATAVGKAILAFLPEIELEDKIKRIEFVPFTENTIRDKESLISNLELIRKLGYSKDLEELENELICVAAPILNERNLPFASISISGPKVRMSEENCKIIGEYLVEITSEISKKIGYIKLK